MSTRITTITAPWITTVAVSAESPAGKHYRKGRERGARARGFAAERGLNLRYFGGKTIEKLTFTNVYLGGQAAWSPDDIQRIDWGLSSAMADPHLNNVIAQYYLDEAPTTTFKPSSVLEGPLPHRVFRDTLEGFVASLDASSALADFDLSSTVVCFMLPHGVVLVDGTSSGHQRRRDVDEPHHRDADDDEPKFNPALRELDEAVNSKHGLGGYHGSIHPRRGSKTETVYYAVGVYSEGANGIVAFDEPWKNVCATFYHELCEARTDPDVEDAIRAGDTPAADKFLGWYSPRGGEIGDIPMEEAGANLGSVMKEVRLSDGSGTVPIQLQWSNAVGGPEGPIAHKHTPAKRA
jgi:hypothetical protein